MDVLIVGANGTVGTVLKEQLGGDDRYEFTYLDVEAHPEDETVVADMTDYEAIRPAFDGQDAVVHLALNPELNFRVTDVSWTRALAENLEGTVNVFGAAVDAGVDSLVFASTNHVVGGYEDELAPDIYDPDFGFRVDHADPPRPDSMYGVAKVFGEALGQFCADYHDLRCYALRIGGVPPDEEALVERAGGDTHAAHVRSVWCSHRDLAQLVDLMLRDDAVEFGVFNGVSDNATRWLDIEHAREVLGYEPRDDSAEWLDQ